MDLDMRSFFTRYVKGTASRASVLNRTRFLCRLPSEVCDIIQTNEEKSAVNMTSRCLKHLYDKKPAEEFLFLLDNLYNMLKHPDSVYFNKGEKRGTFSLVKKMGESEYFCAIEKMWDNPHFAWHEIRLL